MISDFAGFDGLETKYLLVELAGFFQIIHF
jgi:hypothetical protein